MADPFDPGNNDPFAVEPVAKPGQRIAPPDIRGELERTRQSAVQLGAAAQQQPVNAEDVLTAGAY